MYKKVLISLIGVGGAFFSSISNGEADVQQNIKNAASEVRAENAVTVENSDTKENLKNSESCNKII